MHRLLQRQLNQARDPNGGVSYERLLKLVNEAYCENEANRTRADRANEVMAAELSEMLAIKERATSLESAKRIAEAANMAKSQFIANMSHELRTPLNAIIGYTEMLIEDAVAEGGDRQISDHENILRSAQSLLHLINEVLDLSKIESGKLNIEIEEFHIGEVVFDAIADVRPAAAANGTELIVEIADSDMTMRSDPYRLSQCLRNLLSNAVKFTADGHVTLRVWREEQASGSFFNIEVSDSGIGMSPDQLARVLSPFEQGDGSITRKYGGTGLGLTITQQIAQLLGGDIIIESELNRGTRAKLVLRADLAQLSSAA
ncbi:MAG: hypothetical protein IPG56_00485 [Caulobacteraceae bacterium]|nr:hypothetical protein [Caulobacteraceae bacterium]